MLNASSHDVCGFAVLLLPAVDDSNWTTATKVVLYVLFALYLLLGLLVGTNSLASAAERTAAKLRARKVGKQPHPQAAGGGGGKTSDAAATAWWHWQPELAASQATNSSGDSLSLTACLLIAFAIYLPHVLMHIVDTIASLQHQSSAAPIATAGNVNQTQYAYGQGLGSSLLCSTLVTQLLLVTLAATVALPHSASRRLHGWAAHLLQYVCSLLACLWIIGPYGAKLVGLSSLSYVHALVLLVVAVASACAAALLRRPIVHDIITRMPTIRKSKKESAAAAEAAVNGNKDVDQNNSQHNDGQSPQPLKTEDSEAEDDDDDDDDDLEHPKKGSRKSKKKKLKPKTISKAAADKQQSVKQQHQQQHVQPTATTAVVGSRGTDWLSLAKAFAAQHPSLDADALAALTAHKLRCSQPQSPLHYRLSTTGFLSCCRAIAPAAPAVQPKISAHQVRPSTADRLVLAPAELEDPSSPSRLCTLQFSASKYATNDTDSYIHLIVTRVGREHSRVLFKYETIDGTASAQHDYLARTETLVFNPNETHKTIALQITPENRPHGKAAEKREHVDELVFYVKLALDDLADGRTTIGDNHITTVCIVAAEKECKYFVTQSQLIVNEKCGHVTLAVARKGNCKTTGGVEWRTVEGTARAGRDFVGASGQLQFGVGEVEKRIKVPIIDKKSFDSAVWFGFELCDLHAANGAALSVRKRHCLVTIVNDDDSYQLLARVGRLLPGHLERTPLAVTSWRQQFVVAANANAAQHSAATPAQYVCHMLAFFWKVLFACVPPPSAIGSAAAAVLNAVLIGVLVVLLRDCLLCLSCHSGAPVGLWANTLLPLVFVWPELMAIRESARQERTADYLIGHVPVACTVLLPLSLALGQVCAAVLNETAVRPVAVQAVQRWADHAAAHLQLRCLLLAVVLCVYVLYVLFARRFVAALGGGELGGRAGARVLSAVLLGAVWLAYTALACAADWLYI